MNKKRIIALNAVFLSFIFLLGSTSPVNAGVSIVPLDELAIEMLSLEWDDPSPLSAEYLKEVLAQIGIKIVHNPLDDTVMYPRIYSGGRWWEAGDPNDWGPTGPIREFYTYEMSNSLGPTPQHAYWELHTSQDYPWGSNHCYMSNASMDAALERMNNATNDIELQSALNEIQVIFAEQVPLIPLFLSGDSHIIRKEWVNYTDMSGGIFTDSNKWTVLNMNATTGDDEFHMAYPSPPSHLNVFEYVDARSSWAAMLHNDSLLNLDADYQLIPWIAESWVKSTDGMQVNFTMRTGVKFHDGTDVTPDDVKHTIEFTQNATASPRWAEVEKVKNVTIDGQTVVVNLIEPYAWADYDIGRMWILPKAFWEGKEPHDPSYDDVAATGDKVGCGPFEYVGGVEDASFRFIKFADYWYTGGPTMPNITEGVPLPVYDYPRIENITIYNAGGSTTRIIGMDADIYDSERYESYAIETMKDIIAGIGDYADTLKVVESVSEWMYYITFNMGIYPLSDVNVRRAIAYAIDRDACIEFARGGFGEPTWSFIPEVYYPQWFNPNIEKYPTNIETAKQILEDAGYIDIDGDGIRECNVTKPTTTTTVPTTTTTTTTTTEEPTTPANGFTLFFAMLATIVVVYKRRKK